MARQIQYVTANIPAVGAGSVAAPVTGGADIADYNPRSQRTLTGCFITPQTAGARLRIYLRGQIVAEIDSASFSAAYGLLPLGLTYDQGLNFHVEVANTTGAGYGPAQVVLRYETDVG